MELGAGDDNANDLVSGDYTALQPKSLSTIHPRKESVTWALCPCDEHSRPVRRRCTGPLPSTESATARNFGGVHRVLVDTCFGQS